MSEVNMEHAQAVYASICAALDEMEFNYKKYEDDLVVVFGHRGKDFNHDLLLAVEAEREAIRLMEKLPITVNPEKAAEFAVAICRANYGIVCGKFTYDMKDEISFELNQFYSGSLISPENIRRMILALAMTVEAYDDKFMALNNGYLTPDDFE